MSKTVLRSLLLIATMGMLATISTPLVFAGIPQSDCCVDNGTPGCDDPTCEEVVCGSDPFCCDEDEVPGYWDDECAEGAAHLCGELCDGEDPCANANCDDGIDCTEDSCDSESGLCINTPVAAACDDGIPCTENSCNPATGCEYDPDDLFCDDGIACTEDSCDTLTGCMNDPEDNACNDDIECTEDSCDALTGCMNDPEDNACNDDIECTQDSCNPNTGCEFDPVDSLCDDNVECTQDTCSTNDGCENVPDHGVCADAFNCTFDLCNNVTGCDNVPDDGLCDDGIDCTEDSCDTLAGCMNDPEDNACNDDIECTQDSCNPNTGCEYDPVDLLCNDDDMCTEDSCSTVDVPVTSNCCEANGTPGCDDPSCQDIVCGIDPFCCDTAWDGICADEAADLCGDLCIGSAAGCVNKDISADCEDGLFCTGDSCEPDKGCVVNDPCPDFEEGCVIHGACSEDEGRCVPEFDDSACDDNNDCSTDICIGNGDFPTVNGIPGCIHEQLPLCDDTCRSAGYYGAHAGDADGNDNVTGTIADACGCALICGEVLSNTEINDADSYLEALCVAPYGDDGLILARQLATLSLNCCASGYGNDCALDPFLGPLFAECNNTCVNGDPAAMQACYDKVECYNTGGIPTQTPADSDCCTEGGNDTPGCDDPTCQNIVCATDPFCCNTSWDGICAGEAAELCTELCTTELSCEPRLEDNCHDKPLCNEDVGPGFCFEPSPRASSSKRCKEALKRVDGTRRDPIHCTVLPPDEDNCAAGTAGESECCSDPNCVQNDDMCTADICENNVCESVDVCSDCCEANTDPEARSGCDDPDCQELVCAADPFCCDTDWDGKCANQAAQLCGDLCPAPVDPCANQDICGGGCITPTGLKGQCVNDGGPMLVANGGSPSNCVCQPLIIIDQCAEQAICGGGCITPQGQKGQCVNGGTTTLVANADPPSDCVCQPGIIVDECATRDVCGGPCTPIFGGPGQCISTPSPNLTSGTTVDPNCTCQGGIIILCVLGPNGECGGSDGEICELDQSCLPGPDGKCACSGVVPNFCSVGINGECGGPEGEICAQGQICQLGLDGKCGCFLGGEN